MKEGIAISKLVSVLTERFSGVIVSSGPVIESLKMTAMADLRDARDSDVAFYFSREHEAALAQAKPGLLIVGASTVASLKSRAPELLKVSVVVCVKDPTLAMAECSQLFHALWTMEGTKSPGIHPTAQVSDDARLGQDVVIGPFCVVGPKVVIGDRVELVSHVSIGAGVQVGEGSKLYPGVHLYQQVTLGRRVVIHANTVIGADGFGYAQEMDRDLGKVTHQKIAHLGTVVIEDDVEIGASSTVDRATLGVTLIGAGTKIDDQVHIGHNAQVGKGVILCGGICLAGRAEIGDYAMVGGMAGVINAVRVGARAQVAAMSLITKDVPDGQAAAGNPQRDLKEHFRAQVALSRLAKKGGNAK